MTSNSTSSFIEDFVHSLANHIIVEKDSPYEGIDTCLQEEPWCVTCHKRPESGLLCCSRCHTAWYCNSSCQKAHYKSGHREICLSVARDLKRVEEEIIPLRNTPFGDDPVPHNIFETEIGMFSEGPEAHRYMVARRELVESYFQAAFDVEIKEVWEKALYHALVQLREALSDPRGMIYVTPFILLHLNRDDDAFDFVQYWVNLKYIRGNESMMEIMNRHVQSKEGDFFYPRKTNSRFLDLFEQCPEADDQDVFLVFLVTILFIKLRLVAAYDATCQSLYVAFGETTGGRHIQEVRLAVTEMLIDESLVNIDSQRQQVERLVNAIDRNNPSMLPALLNPLPLLTQSRPPPDIRGDPSEAFDIVNYCNRCFSRIPGALKMLEERYGPNPTYNTTMRYGYD